eukprot:Skav210555  [mRNA]  locus=scaffold2699:59613:65460:- [translate_table: standard]
MYTLYEITFAGNWPTNARPVLDKVSQFFVIFYLLYVTIIVFAVIRVISAIFLKDTLDEANNDAQQLVPWSKLQALWFQEISILSTREAASASYVLTCCMGACKNGTACSLQRRREN